MKSVIGLYFNHALHEEVFMDLVFVKFRDMFFVVLLKSSDGIVKFVSFVSLLSCMNWMEMLIRKFEFNPLRGVLSELS